MLDSVCETPCLQTQTISHVTQVHRAVKHRLIQVNHSCYICHTWLRYPGSRPSAAQPQTELSMATCPG